VPDVETAMTKLPKSEYSESETQQRFEAALRGARVAGHKPLKEPATKQAVKPKRRHSTRGKSKA
jgi:hypothetical protein